MSYKRLNDLNAEYNKLRDERDALAKRLENSVDITPDRDGAIRFARMLIQQGGKDAEVGRKILAEYGIEE